MIKRLFDIFLSLVLLVILLVPMFFIAVIIKTSSVGNVLYWSNRIGRDNIIFRMPKFRSMRVDTPVVATHLLKNPEASLTPVGSFLRRYSIDEVPQLWSVIIGDMSFVGPRPALFNQNDLIKLRQFYGVDKVLPGITGWAQINGRDELLISKKVELDFEYVKKYSFFFDLKILYITLIRVIKKNGVSY
jgi:O-antigen biosynthesis protein WbqP